MSRILAALAMLAALLLTGCGYNEFQTRDEQVKAAWSEVLNQYKRRADLIPNLVATVQGYAAHEKEVLTGVTEARARATSVQLPAEALGRTPPSRSAFGPAGAGATRCARRVRTTLRRPRRGQGRRPETRE